MKTLTLFAAVLFSLIALGQEEGTYLTPDDPICANWEYIGNPSESPRIAGIWQNYFSIVSGANRSSLEPSKWINNPDSECPHYFNLSKDDKHFYLGSLNEPCNSNPPEIGKFITVEYNVGEVKKVNTIEINGSKHEIEEMKTILTLTIDGKNYHYTRAEE